MTLSYESILNDENQQKFKDKGMCIIYHISGSFKGLFKIKPG